MLILPSDLVSALVFLSLIEGFRRISADQVVLTSWRGKWSTRNTAFSIWFRRIGWFWIAPAFFSPRTFVLTLRRQACTGPNGAMVAALRQHMEGLATRQRLREVLTAAQTLLIFLVLPAAAVFTSAKEIYVGVVLVLITAALIAFACWRDLRWSALRYCLYPPASLFAVADIALNALERFHTDLILAILLPRQDAERLLRREFRLRRFGPDAYEDPKHVEQAMLSLLSLARLNVDHVMAEPVQITPGTRSFCPCCEACYAIESGECSDCPGVRLQSVEETIEVNLKSSGT